MAQQPSKTHEFFRKRLVTLKRKPQIIPLLVLCLAFIYYSFNLSFISNSCFNNLANMLSNIRSLGKSANS